MLSFGGPWRQGKGFGGVGGILRSAQNDRVGAESVLQLLMIWGGGRVQSAAAGARPCSTNTERATRIAMRELV